jgi:enterochelin esterase-like enzyme
MIFKRLAILFIVGVTVSILSACSLLQEINLGAINPKGEKTQTEAAPTATVTPQPTPTPSCTEDKGQVTQVELPSALQPHPLVVSIYTPPCFTETPQEPYPVLYLLHGQAQDDTFWLSLGIADIVDGAINSGQRPFLMVMPYEENNFDAIDQTQFPNIIITELIPWVEANYPVCTARECRAIGGISRGAGWAVRLSERNFDLFSSVGAHSIGLLAGDSWRIYKLHETYTADQFPRYYVDRGEDDFLAHDIDLFMTALKDNGLNYEYHVSPGDHSRSYWREHVQEYMDWYMQAWK